jgi:multimeric flavodoxin WrbA
MKITVINGTEIRGCTYHIKETFLKALGAGHEITEFTLPKDAPHFCSGCKVCFFKSENQCPHATSILPIWNAMLAADLLVFAYPVYVLRTPGQVKALLDHLGCHWIVHRPDARMFTKRTVILTNSIGAPNGAAQKDVATSLAWIGVSSIKKLGFGLMEGVIWEELSAPRRAKIEAKTKAFAAKLKSIKPARKNLKHRAIWLICKILHKIVLKKENPPGTDNQYWIDKGWIKI